MDIKSARERLEASRAQSQEAVEAIATLDSAIATATAIQTTLQDTVAELEKGCDRANSNKLTILE